MDKIGNRTAKDNFMLTVEGSITAEIESKELLYIAFEEGMSNEIIANI